MQGERLGAACSMAEQWKAWRNARPVAVPLIRGRVRGFVAG